MSVLRCLILLFLLIEDDTIFIDCVGTGGTCHANSIVQHVITKDPGPDLSETAWQKLESYMDTICTRCARRLEVECGCDLGRGNPTFQLLHKQAVLQSLNMMQLRTNSSAVDAQTWLIYTVQGGGIGNTLHDLATALALAIVIGRPLSVDLLVS